MIIWRGWGILAVIYAAAAFVTERLLIDAFNPGGELPFVFGFGLLLAGVATWFTGVALNRNMPKRKFAALSTAREAELAEYVANGTFSRGPGHPLPQTHQEARVMADTLFEEEQAAWLSALSNRHTLFFIPLQYWGIALGVLSIFSMISDI
ncbi:hypothetical protein [Lysinibacter cavernae]|uniref:Uncharacterized protein n=1 Tax=Lysinibacter cavernae TaxID=1640652 RepID=A0A7X5QZQ2_9MICO|nr:hypothetical protein [Lysinibacter cavernae]NIH52995.1 hypothetical protein [Lysinibacter cavernae]